MRWFKNLFKRDSGKSVQSFTVAEITPQIASLFARTDNQALDSNTIIQANLRFIRRAVTQASIKFLDGEGQQITPPSAVERLMKRPNELYGEKSIRSALAMDLSLTGNAYLIVDRTLRGVERLNWFSSFHVKPHGRGLDIDYYLVSTLDGSQRVEPERVIHFRDGIDPRDTRLGYSPLRCLLSEVLTDNEAQAYTFWILFNRGVVGTMLSPKQNDMFGGMTQEQAAEIKKKFSEEYSGVNRGKSFVSTFPMDITQFGVNPNDMVLDAVRNIPEERICAVFGIPSAVVGLGTGMEQTKVGATMEELRREAYEGGVIPLQTIIADTYSRFLFDDESDIELVYDNSNVKVFSENENEIHERVRNDFRAGLLTLGEASDLLGYTVDDADRDLRSFDLAMGRVSGASTEIKSQIYNRMRQRVELTRALLGENNGIGIKAE